MPVWMRASSAVAVLVAALPLIYSSSTGCGYAQEDEMQANEIAAIKRGIEEAYVDGVHSSQDIEKIRSGFQSEFRMMVLDGGAVKPVRVEQWLQRVDELKAGNPELWERKTTVQYDMIDVTGRSAVAKLHVFKGGEFFSTDYMFLYKIGDAWMIVSKVFVTEPAP